MKKPASLFFLTNAITGIAIAGAIGLSSLSLFGEEENKNRPERESHERRDSDKPHDDKAGRAREPQHEGRPQGKPSSNPAGNFEAQVNEIRKQIQKLTQEGRGEDAAAAERRLREMMERQEQARNRERDHDRAEHGRPPGPRPEQFQEMERRIHHLFAAAKNLDQAGMNREANELRKHAENMERELQGPHHPGEGQGREIEALHHKVAELNEIVHDLRRHIEIMEEELDDLREEIEEDDDDDDDDNRAHKGPRR